MQLVVAAVLYFGLTYLAGFAFGSLRELLIVPRIGQLAATAIETPMMLAASYFAARFVIGRFDQRPAMRGRAIIGMLAFGLLMVAEIIFAGLIRGWSFEQWLSHMKTAEGAISLVLFVLFGLFPLVVRRA